MCLSDMNDEIKCDDKLCIHEFLVTLFDIVELYQENVMKDS